MRARSKYFIVSGGIGGLLGFILMGFFEELMPGEGSRVGYIVRNAFYFSGFGLAVGAALGMTEGLVQRKMAKMVYGLIVGLLLGAVGGFIGGAGGQFIYGLLPVQQESRVDVAIVIDSSGSMGRQFNRVPPSDPDGERRKAARELVDLLSETDRVAVIDFDDSAQVLFPLTPLSSAGARRGAKRAIDHINDDGGTNFEPALRLSINELERHQEQYRQQHLIFLTDGQANIPRAQVSRARALGITIHTVGLGDYTIVPILQTIAHTPAHYYPVANASDLAATFKKIYEEQIDMTKSVGQQSSDMRDDGLDELRYVFRILSWALMGLVIGFGQGVRENTALDLRACSLGGMIGGIIGGALFDPLTQMIQFGGELGGLGTADVVVGACIGGSMRMMQQRLVKVTEEERGEKLVPFLPKGTGLVINQPSTGLAPDKTTKRSGLASRPGQRKPLSYFEAEYPDRGQAMVMAFRSGFYSKEDIAEHFGVHVQTVERTIQRQQNR